MLEGRREEKRRLVDAGREMREIGRLLDTGDEGERR